MNEQTKIEIDNLVRRLKNGEDAAMGELYDRYASTLYGLASKIVHSDEVAQDVVQDSFVKVWKRIKTFDDSKGTFFTWMLNITRNTAIDFLRKTKKESGRSIQDLENDVHMDAGNTLNIDTLGLRNIVADLKEDQRILVEYIYFKGYTQQEVSDELDIPLGTVKTRIRTAVKEMKRYFGILLTFIFWT